jgi:hypothetical protein
MNLKQTILAAALSILCATSQAYATPLSSLITESGSIVEGGLVFSNFAFELSSTTHGNFSPIDASGVNVVSVLYPNQAALRFSGPFSSSLNDYTFSVEARSTGPTSSFLSLRFIYDVTAASHQLLPALQETVALRVTGDSFATVEAWAYNSADLSQLLGNTVFSLSNDTPVVSQSLSVFAVDVPSIRVVTQLTLSANNTFTSDPFTADIFPVEIRHSTVRNAVPESSSILLLASGLALLGLLRSVVRWTQADPCAVICYHAATGTARFILIYYDQSFSKSSFFGCISSCWVGSVWLGRIPKPLVDSLNRRLGSALAPAILSNK